MAVAQPQHDYSARYNQNIYVRYFDINLTDKTTTVDNAISSCSHANVLNLPQSTRSRVDLRVRATWTIFFFLRNTFFLVTFFSLAPSRRSIQAYNFHRKLHSSRQPHNGEEKRCEILYGASCMSSSHFLWLCLCSRTWYMTKCQFWWSHSITFNKNPISTRISTIFLSWSWKCLSQHTIASRRKEAAEVVVFSP